MTWDEAAAAAGLSKGTLQNLGTQDPGPKDETLLGVARLLGISFEAACVLRTSDIASKYGGPEGWPPEAYRLGARAAGMTPAARKALIDIADALAMNGLAG